MGTTWKCVNHSDNFKKIKIHNSDWLWTDNKDGSAHDRFKDKARTICPKCRKDLTAQSTCPSEKSVRTVGPAVAAWSCSAGITRTCSKPPPSTLSIAVAV